MRFVAIQGAAYSRAVLFAGRRQTGIGALQMQAGEQRFFVRVQIEGIFFFSGVAGWRREHYFSFQQGDLDILDIGISLDVKAGAEYAGGEVLRMYEEGMLFIAGHFEIRFSFQEDLAGCGLAKVFCESDPASGIQPDLASVAECDLADLSGIGGEGGVDRRRVQIEIGRASCRERVSSPV